MEKVSIVITAYNVEDYILRAVASVKDQTWPSVEIIVVEDCSTDGTLDVLKDEDGIKLIVNESNLGAGKSRQIGIKAATGEFVLLLDADDWLEPDCIESLIKTQRKYRSDMTGCNIRVVRDSGTEEETTEECELSGLDKFKIISGKTPFLNPILVRRELYNRVEYCPRRFIEDSPTLWKLLFFANKLVYSGKVGYNYYQRQNSLCHTSSVYKRYLFSALAIIDIILFLKQNNGIDILKETGLVDELISIYGCIVLNQTASPDKDNFTKERQFIDKFVGFLKGQNHGLQER